LETMNALEDGRDVLVDSGCMIIPNLMHPHTASITISPLKRLQIMQVSCCTLSTRATYFFV
ncbi:hypothetical protein B0H14DRAFT_2380957, partial [Mycena olivaceomarginata]